MKKIVLEGSIRDHDLFVRDYYFGQKTPEFSIEDYFVNPLQKGSKKFFQDVYDTFDGKSGTQHALLMTELGELNCAYIDMKNAGDLLYDSYTVSDHEKFEGVDSVPLEYSMAARKLAAEDHVREEVADVLMLLYQFAVLSEIDVASIPIKKLDTKMSLQDVMEKLTGSISSFDHQLNRQARGREDFSPEQTRQHLINAISYANLFAFHMDNKSKIQPINRQEYVLDDKAKGVQQWFDYKVERTQQRMDDKGKK